MSVPEPLRKILEAYCHVNATNIDLLAEHYKSDDWSYSHPELFKEQLWEVINNRTVSIMEYDEITKEEFESIDELYVWLVEVWNQVIGGSIKS